MNAETKHGGPVDVLAVGNNKVDVLGSMERASKWMFCKRTGPDREMNLWLSRRMVEELLESLDAYLDNSTVETRMGMIEARNRIGSMK